MQKNNSKILILEKNESFKELLKLDLVYKGFHVNVASFENKDAISIINEFEPAIIILGSDFNYAKNFSKVLRTKDSKIWLFWLSENSQTKEKIEVLEAGADNCIDRKLPIDEIIAKLRTAFRRLNENSTNSVYQYYDLKMDLIKREVWRANNLIDLRTKEFELLKLFLQYPEEVLTHQFIFDRVWESTFLGDSNVIEVYVRYLRSKLGKPLFIKTKRGKGYILISEEAQIKRSKIEELETI